MWIPPDIASSWENGAYLSCINCGTRFQAKKEGKTYVVKEAGGAAPVAAAQAPAPEPAQAPQPDAAPAPAASPPSAVEASETVLLIEDDRLSREMADQSLKDTGIRLLAAKNATEALKLLRTENVNLLVTDLYLKNPDDPESQLDGEELLKRISDSGVHLPAIITTGKDIIDDIVLDPKWFDLRVKGFIQKGNPFWVEELKLKIKEVLYKD
jgi:CheY-like chemotaxis protein